MDELNSVWQWLARTMGPYAPRLIGALTIAVIAWIVARLLRSGLLRLAGARQLDERLRSPGLGARLADVAYWLVWLLALPALLETLQMQGLLAPVQAMMARLLGFLPSLFGAAVVLGVGLLVAQIVRQVVSGLLRAAGSERLAARLGLSAAVGEEGLAGLAGLIVFVLVLLPVVAGALQPLGLDAVTSPVSRLLDSVIAVIPKLVAAAIIIVIAALVGRALSSLVTALLAGIGFNALPGKLGLPGSVRAGGRSAAELGGALAMAAVMLIAVTQACEVLGFAALTEMVTTLGVVLARLLVAVLLFGVGLWLATLASNTIRSSAVANAPVLAGIARVAILFFTAALALRQAGLPAEIVTIAFASVIGALAVGVAIAIG
ncbi:MAG TPA: mechanosensitive ion channel, partial [Burkholderiaceae bacterium]|nr:mechanosensitive ion channel [Burkholderiaceae bacterium]